MASCHDQVLDARLRRHALPVLVQPPAPNLRTLETALSHRDGCSSLARTDALPVSSASSALPCQASSACPASSLSPGQFPDLRSPDARPLPGAQRRPTTAPIQRSLRSRLTRDNYCTWKPSSIGRKRAFRPQIQRNLTEFGVEFLNSG